jgi:hypothetical protein
VPVVEEAKPGEDNDVVELDAPIDPPTPEAGDDDVVDTAAPEAPVVAEAPADLDLDLDAELAALEANKE